VGGASRNEKKRRQEVANQRPAAAGVTPPKQAGGRIPLLVVAGVVAVAVVVGLVALLTRGSGEPIAADYPVSASGAVVTAGQDTAPVTVDIWSDFICPACERFEERYGDELTEALNTGQITVRYHEIGLLDEFSEPPGYSTRAANAALCAVPAGLYPAYRDRLFADQPAEGGPGLSDDELVAIGAELGAPASFGECVRSGMNTAAVTAETRATIDDPALRNEDGNVGTPTVAVGGERVDIGDSSWLSDLIAAG
jgi:protein-disulfide isomerase